MATKIEASELMDYYATWLKDRGKNFIKEGESEMQRVTILREIIKDKMAC